MKKEMRNVLLGMMLIFAAVLTGCGNGNTKAFDATEVANRLLEEITYQDELTVVDFDTAGMILNFSNVNVVNGLVFEGSGATAEEIVVLECASDEDADAAKAALQARVQEQIESFTDYVPQELEKLNQAVIVESGKYAVLSVSSEPDLAKKIIGEYIK